jgi:stalled ribosome alternative rescue factor ArfA
MIRRINPIAKAMLQNRRRASVVPPKKGKGSYDRKKKEPTQKELDLC